MPQGADVSRSRVSKYDFSNERKKLRTYWFTEKVTASKLLANLRTTPNHRSTSRYPVLSCGSTNFSGSNAFLFTIHIAHCKMLNEISPQLQYDWFRYKAWYYTRLKVLRTRIWSFRLISMVARASQTFALHRAILVPPLKKNGSKFIPSSMTDVPECKKSVYPAVKKSLNSTSVPCRLFLAAKPTARIPSISSYFLLLLHWSCRWSIRAHLVRISYGLMLRSSI